MKMCIALVPLAAIGLTGYTALSARGAHDTSFSIRQEGPGSRIAFTRLVDDVTDSTQHFELHAEIWIMNGTARNRGD